MVKRAETSHQSGGSMAKKSAKKRKAAVSHSGSDRKFVKTGEAAAAMQRLLNDLKDAKRGETGWGLGDHAKVAAATLLLELTIKKIKCPPSESFPGSGLHRAPRRVK
jgi:hypothetical protein